MRDLDLLTLRLFVSVCELGSLARAAEQNHLVASAVSKRMAALETTVGTALFVRVKHGVRPTAAGQALLEHAREMLARSARIERDMGQFSRGIVGQVRVLASASAMAEYLADDIAAFLQAPEHRAIRIELEERVSPDIVRGVREGAAALGVCWDATDHSGLLAYPYSKDELCVAVNNTHRLAKKKSIRFEQLLDDEHASMPINSAVQRLLQRAAAQLGKPISHRVTVSNFESALRVVSAGLAISVVPKQVAQIYQQALGLKLIALDEQWAIRQFIVCSRSEEELTLPARALRDHLFTATRTLRNRA